MYANFNKPYALFINFIPCEELIVFSETTKQLQTTTHGMDRRRHQLASVTEEAQKLRVALCYATSSHPMQLCAMHANYVNGQYTNCVCTKTMATTSAAAAWLACYVC